MTVKEATLADAAAVAGLFDAYRIYYEQSSDPAGAEAFIADRLRNRESVIYLAQDQGRPIGFTQLYPFFTSVGMKRAWVLNDLYVSEEYRNRGVGRALIAAAQDFARSTSAKWIMLQTYTSNVNAQALYEKLGFEKDTGSYYYYLSL
ncbi:GNAT family N-acetyltransferase [uncultured Chitinophaga sp.]|jgi:Acetyltransferases|uniref:GNAT family N-acetyltransferase n=1 Tax=uncultured Chitinophaga sp. TaxID=339340 RepID=UPI002635C4CD|nr:GNAT family N-acetyltransferase [uncultured Chitinophaga sp.]